MTQRTTIIIQGQYDTSLDTSAIQNACDELAFDYNDTRQGCVVLEGRFRINETIRAGKPESKPVIIRSDSEAHIARSTVVSPDYLFTFESSGNYFSREPLISNIRFYSNAVTRGVLFKGLPDSYLMDSCYVYMGDEVGVDIIDCPNSSIHNTHFVSGRGVNLRLRGGGLYCTKTRFSGYGLINASGNLWNPNVTAIKDMVMFEMASGEKETRLRYGGAYKSYWPDVNDTTVTDLAGNYVTTPPERRACLDLAGGNCYFHQNIFESIYYGDKPVVVCTPNNSEWTVNYLEAVYTNCMWRIISDDDTDTVYYPKFDKISLATSKEFPINEFNQLRQVVHCSGVNTVGLQLSRVRGHSISTSSIILDSGNHYGMDINRFSCWYDNIPSSGNIVNINANMYDDIPTGKI